MGGQSAAHEQGGPDERPDSHARLAHDGHRHAGGAAKAEQLGNKSGPGFANADLKGDKFEGHGNQTVRRLNDERGEERGRRAQDQPQGQVFLDHAKRMKRQFEDHER